MHEARQHRQFIKSLHTLIHSEKTEDERAREARDAVLTYAAALNEIARTSAADAHGESGYIELHLTKAHNWVVAWQTLSDPVDPATARICEAAVRALDDEKDRLHSQMAAAGVH